MLEMWIAVMQVAGLVMVGKTPEAHVAWIVDVVGGANRLAVETLLLETIRLCAVDRFASAVDHAKLAARLLPDSVKERKIASAPAAMFAANERVRECWDRACALAGFKGAGRGSIGAQVDAAVEVLTGAELVAARALFGEAWRLVSQRGDAEGAAEHLRLGAAVCEQRGRVLGALKAAQAVEDAVWPGDVKPADAGRGAFDFDPSTGRGRGPFVRDRIVWAMEENGFGLQEPK